MNRERTTPSACGLITERQHRTGRRPFDKVAGKTAYSSGLRTILLDRLVSPL
jgi:hypothetical protein